MKVNKTGTGKISFFQFITSIICIRSIFYLWNMKTSLHIYRGINCVQSFKSSFSYFCCLKQRRIISSRFYEINKITIIRKNIFIYIILYFTSSI